MADPKIVLLTLNSSQSLSERAFPPSSSHSAFNSHRWRCFTLSCHSRPYSKHDKDKDTEGENATNSYKASFVKDNERKNCLISSD
ncbi:uncharacterized [Tachysurus ichikawai]